MQVSPQDSGSSAGSATGQQSSGAATGEASAAAGRSQRGTGADMPFMRPSPRKHAGGWMGRAAAATVGESIGAVAPKISHQDVFLGKRVCHVLPRAWLLRMRVVLHDANIQRALFALYRLSRRLWPSSE